MVARYPELAAGIPDHLDEVVRIASRVLRIEARYAPPKRPAKGWECPCGKAEPKPGSTATPTGTLVSLRERWPFCGGKFKEECWL